MSAFVEKNAAGLGVLSGVLALGAALGLAEIMKSQTPIGPLPASSGPAATLTAADKQALAALGRGYFIQSCAHCHGDDARGDEGPNLHGLKISNARIEHRIRNGSKGRMPSFAKKYGPAGIAALREYLRTLN
ncbi:MAG: cytochrome c [Methylacidiphilales bacterium]|nr:cytochrome c [Candidatus Methylacidiphilales bacterium]